ncbi:hypothetical protein MHU86_19052 [Fragilaria crotonensis]|nr:hypothetical protein MHU86_19052 [Fragilaria crotonensis]
MMLPLFQCGTYVCPGTPAEETADGVYNPSLSTLSDQDQLPTEQPILVPTDSGGTQPADEQQENHVIGQQQQQQQQQQQPRSTEHEAEIEQQMRKFLQQVTLKPGTAKQVVVEKETEEDDDDEEEDGQVHAEKDEDNDDGHDVEEVDTSFDDSFQMGMDSASFKELKEKEIDLDFVEEYDIAFHEFLSRHPRFLISNPTLVHHIRVIKLQKLLDGQNRLEQSIEDQLEKIMDLKRSTELGWQEQLRDAAGKKAARETHLQSYLSNVNYATKCMEAQWTWHIVCDAQHCIKKEHLLKMRLQQQQQVGDHPLDLLNALPEGPDFDDLRNAMLAPAGQTLSEEQEKDLRQFQMDNAFLAAEVAVLKKKLAYQKATTKRHAWVESVLLRMDERSLRKLKNRFQKRVGVPL